ncbi:hypothetical protein NPIL_372181 [Nephila pilipes]|uniref:Uncharacterized protein n=1 Tax=Nephila pilipes TaxID=299642 RepID=A0A8X6PX43_NEPPI|nr:hypothetical protein NPIL_372181 [Nephila pilipes]
MNYQARVEFLGSGSFRLPLALSYYRRISRPGCFQLLSELPYYGKTLEPGSFQLPSELPRYGKKFGAGFIQRFVAIVIVHDMSSEELQQMP